jgi:hypothetical protein
MAGFLISMAVIFVVGHAAGAWVWFSIPKIHRQMKDAARAERQSGEIGRA